MHFRWKQKAKGCNLLRPLRNNKSVPFSAFPQKRAGAIVDPCLFKAVLLLLSYLPGLFIHPERGTHRLYTQH
jgi:hypothetical protein